MPWILTDAGYTALKTLWHPSPLRVKIFHIRFSHQRYYDGYSSFFPFPMIIIPPEQHVSVIRFKSNGWEIQSFTGTHNAGKTKKTDLVAHKKHRSAGKFPV